MHKQRGQWTSGYLEEMEIKLTAVVSATVISHNAIQILPLCYLTSWPAHTHMNTHTCTHTHEHTHLECVCEDANPKVDHHPSLCMHVCVRVCVCVCVCANSLSTRCCQGHHHTKPGCHGNRTYTSSPSSPPAFFFYFLFFEHTIV